MLRKPYLNKAPQHEPDHGQTQVGGSEARGVLIVLRQPPVSAHPGESPLDDPSLWQDHKPVQIRAFDDLDTPRAECSDSGGRGSSLIAAIGGDAFDERKQPAHRLQDKQAAVTVLHVGGMSHEVERQTERIDNDVALLAVDRLTGVVAGRIDAGPLFPRSLPSGCR